MQHSDVILSNWKLLMFGSSKYLQEFRTENYPGNKQTPQQTDKHLYITHNLLSVVPFWLGSQ